MYAYEVGSAIRARMLQKSITKEALARKMGVTNRNITAMVEGDKPWRLDYAVEALHILGLDIQIIYKED